MVRQGLVTGTLIIVCVLHTVIATSYPPNYANPIFVADHFEGTEIKMFTPKSPPMPYLSLPENFDTITKHDKSENLNNLRFPRNGHGVRITAEGLEIGKGGFLYERLAPGFTSTRSLVGYSFQIQYTSPIDQKVRFSVLQKIQSSDPRNPPLIFVLKAFNLTQYSIKGVRENHKFHIKSFDGVYPTHSIALRIDGPLTVHRIELVEARKRYPEVVDDCKSWKDPFVDNTRLLFSPSYPHYIKNNEILNVNLGGGGETFRMMTYPELTVKNYALRIIYTAHIGGLRKMQVLQDIWSEDTMTITSITDEFAFEKGNGRTLIVRMKNIENITGIILHGPLLIHRVEVVSLLHHGVVQSDYEDPDFDFGVNDFDFEIPDFDFYG